MWYETAIFVSGTVGGVGLAMLFNWLRYRSWDADDYRRDCGFDYNSPPLDLPSGIDPASNPFWQNRHGSMGGENVSDRRNIPISPETQRELDATLHELSDEVMRNNALARRIADGSLNAHAPTFDTKFDTEIERRIAGAAANPALLKRLRAKGKIAAAELRAGEPVRVFPAAFDAAGVLTRYRCLECGEPCGPSFYCDLHVKGGTR